MGNVSNWRNSQGAAPAPARKPTATLPANLNYEHRNYGNDGEGWVLPQNANRDAVVFVHGFTGDFRATWAWKSPRWRFWKKEQVHLLQDLLVPDRTISLDYYSFAHSSQNFDLNGIGNLADALRTFLDTTVANGRTDRRVILVSHSLGGLLCRQAIINQLEPSIRRNVQIVGLLMMGTPNLGTEVARFAIHSASADDIRPFDEYLDRLNRAWLQRVVNGGDPDVDPASRLRLKCGALYGLIDRVVPATSAKSGVYLGEIHAVNKGHIALPKCQTRNDPVYSVLADFIRQSLAEAEETTFRQSADNLSYRVRHGVLNSPEWTYSESEIVELSPQPTRGPDVLSCEITSTRTGWDPQPEVTICIHLEGSAPKFHFDFAYIFGQGTLSNLEFGALGDSLKQQSLTMQEFSRLLTAEVELFATHSGTDQNVPLAQPQLVRGPGYACLKFPIVGPSLEGRANRLQLRLKTILRRHSGWYGYRARRTILGETDIQLIAPFSLHPVTRIWWSNPQWENVPLGTDRYSSKVTIPGPLPSGTDIMWIFEPEGQKQSKEEVNGSKAKQET